MKKMGNEFMKPVEFYVALIASAMYVFENNKEKPFLSRFFITLSSAGFGFSVAPELSKYIFGSLTLTGILVTALGFLVLEVTSAVVSDTAFVNKIIGKRLGTNDEV